MIVGLGRWFRPSNEKYKAKGDYEVWPFLRKQDYENVLGAKTESPSFEGGSRR